MSATLIEALRAIMAVCDADDLSAMDVREEVSDIVDAREVREALAAYDGR